MDHEALKQHLVAHETWLLQLANRRDLDTVASLLTDDFRECGTSGRIFTKPELLDLLAAEPSMTLTADTLELMEVGDSVALLTYNSTKTTETETLRARRSSLWIRQGVTWRMLFHQGTTIVDDQSPAATPSAI